MSTPLVSIVIPAFNSCDYIVDAIESALAQTYSSIEVIVVDDGSTDQTRETLNDLAKSGRIHYHFQPNRGLGAARNTGIRLSQGQYLQFLDADDLISPTKIERQVLLLESSPQMAICGCDFRFFDESDVAKLYGGDTFKGQFPLHSVTDLFEFETVIHRWLFPASLVRDSGGFEESSPKVWLMEDWLMLWKMLASGARLLFIDEPLALYRRHGSNMTANFERAATGHFLALDHVERYQGLHGISLYSRRELNALRECYHYELGLFYLRRNRAGRAWYQLMKALVLSPNRRQVKLLLVATIPALGASAMDWVTSANDRLWRWRTHLRKTLVG
jgi:glycosyltransferase involved in cell wall biosynthesis